jgi:predicted metal-dependent hydrolase
MLSVAQGKQTVLQGGRPKAYRPIPEADRQAALAAGLEAYERGDVFLAHELLEPAWMGTRDLAERELLQGTIKLAAAFVHAARGNAAGVAKNLRGARERLANAGAATGRTGIDVATLLQAIDARLDQAIQVTDPPIAIPRPGTGQARERLDADRAGLAPRGGSA